MTRKAYIKLVSNSSQTAITKDELKTLFHYYKKITSKTGTQIDWKYDQAAFPYEIKELPNQQDNSFHLYSKQDRYHSILIGIKQETTNDENGNHISKLTYKSLYLAALPMAIKEKQMNFVNLLQNNYKVIFNYLTDG